MQRIRKELSVSMVEDALRNAASSETIVIPRRFKKSALGASASLLQFLATWARSKNNAIVATYLKSPFTEDQIQSMHGNLGSLAAIHLSDTILSQDKIEITDLVKNSSISHLRSKASGGRVSRGTDSFIVCIDHTSLPASPFLYSQKSEVRGRRDFKTLARELVDRVSGNWKRVFHNGQIHEFGIILHELFRNTHQWARHDREWSELARSIRGIHCSSLSEFQPRLERVFGVGTPAAEYLRGLEHPETPKRMAFIEFSVFDNGPGLPARWLGGSYDNNLDASELSSACIACLLKKRSSSSKIFRGDGLYHVMRVLSPWGAFLRIRTDRLNLYRDFNRYPLDHNAEAKDIRLFDWESRTEEKRLHPMTAGLVYTILLPYTAS